MYASAQHEFLNPKWQKHQSFTTTWNQRTRRDEKPTMLRLRLEFGLNRGLIPEVGQGDLLSRACVHGLNVENETKSIVEQLVMIHRIGSLQTLLYGFPFPSYFEQVHKIIHQLVDYLRFRGIHIADIAHKLIRCK